MHRGIDFTGTLHNREQSNRHAHIKLQKVRLINFLNMSLTMWIIVYCTYNQNDVSISIILNWEGNVQSVSALPW